MYDAISHIVRNTTPKFVVLSDTIISAKGQLIIRPLIIQYLLPERLKLIDFNYEDIDEHLPIGGAFRFNTVENNNSGFGFMLASMASLHDNKSFDIKPFGFGDIDIEKRRASKIAGRSIRLAQQNPG